MLNQVNCRRRVMLELVFRPLFSCETSLRGELKKSLDVFFISSSTNGIILSNSLNFARVL